MAAQQVHPVRAQRAEGSATVGHHLALGGQLGKARFEFVEGHRDGARDVASRVLSRGADVDHDDVARFDAP